MHSLYVLGTSVLVGDSKGQLSNIPLYMCIYRYYWIIRRSNNKDTSFEGKTPIKNHDRYSWWKNLHQLRLGSVYPIIYKLLAPSQRWLALGFLKHQQVGDQHTTDIAPGADSIRRQCQPWELRALTWQGCLGGNSPRERGGIHEFQTGTIELSLSSSDFIFEMKSYDQKWVREGVQKFIFAFGVECQAWCVLHKQFGETDMCIVLNNLCTSIVVCMLLRNYCNTKQANSLEMVVVGQKG